MEDDMTTEFVAVRHGETDENLHSILQGQSDTHLNALGIRQAECVAERLKHEHFDLIYSSDLQRAMRTAELIAEPHKLPVFPLRALREWNLGALQGGKWEDLRVKFPAAMQAFREERVDFQVPDGESRADFYQRVADCLDEMSERFEGKRILLVSHGGALKAMFRHVVGQVAESSRLPLTSNASVSQFRYVDGFWQLVSWNDIYHLRSLGENESIVF